MDIMSAKGILEVWKFHMWGSPVESFLGFEYFGVGPLGHLYAFLFSVFLMYTSSLIREI